MMSKKDESHEKIVVMRRLALQKLWKIKVNEKFSIIIVV